MPTAASDRPGPPLPTHARPERPPPVGAPSDGSPAGLGLAVAERGLAPLPLLRFGVRRLLRQRLAEEYGRACGDVPAAVERWLASMRQGPIALVPETANAQHYEVPPAFFELCLGPRLKYSACYFPRGDEGLAEAEEHMLALTAERAELGPGQRILELGCGWGSLTLWMAEHYPTSRIVALSNSAPQRRFIEGRARERGLSNVDVRTADVNVFETTERFDRIVSVEMFEHLRNWEALLARARRWLHDDGRLFVHVFAHKELPYPFEVRDGSDWLSRHFFTGGMMPSDDLLRRVDAPFRVAAHHTVSGTHYSRTARLWRENLESRRSEAMAVLRRTYGRDAARWFQRWRLFYLACEELFGYDAGREWVVSHHTLRPIPIQPRSEGDAHSE
jgi:cyclopropane-fatty-acyl-phospholipid synthase